MNIFQHHVRRVLNKYLLYGVRDRKDMLAFEVLAPLSVRYLPWSSSAMRPSGLVTVLNDIVINNRSRVVECGSGISTFYMARLLKQRGGHVVSIEHDERWAHTVAEMLEAEALSEHATVIFAPLAKSQHSWNGSLWYDEDRLRCIADKLQSPVPIGSDRSAVIGNGAIDLLLVDGPPAYEKESRYARYPAVPFFKSSLASNYTVILDDIDRRGEQEIIERWERELCIAFDRRFMNGTIAVGRSRESFWV
jgi:hypothetical protein